MKRSPSLASRVIANSLGWFDRKVWRYCKPKNPVDSVWKSNGRARLCGQIEQGSLRSLEKPDSVIASSSFVFLEIYALKNTANQVTSWFGLSVPLLQREESFASFQAVYKNCACTAVLNLEKAKTTTINFIEITYFIAEFCEKSDNCAPP